MKRLLFDYVYPRVRSSISNQQLGFMQSLITVTQILSYLDHIYSLSDNNVPVVELYFDVKNAFDSAKTKPIMDETRKVWFGHRLSDFYGFLIVQQKMMC